MTSHAGSIDHIVTSSPDDRLLLMLKQLTSRLNDLESQSVTEDMAMDVGDISLNDQILTPLKLHLFTLIGKSGWLSLLLLLVD